MEAKETENMKPVVMTEFRPEHRAPLDDMPAEMIERVFTVVFTLKANAEADPDQKWTIFDHKAGQVDAEAIMVGWRCGIIRLAIIKHRESGASRFLARQRIIGEE